MPGDCFERSNGNKGDGGAALRGVGGTKTLPTTAQFDDLKSESRVQTNEFTAAVYRVY